MAANPDKSREDNPHPAELDAEGCPVATVKSSGGARSESMARLVAMLGHAIIAMGFNRLSLSVRQSLVSVFGLVALFCPLALWIAWTTTMLWTFLALAVCRT